MKKRKLTIETLKASGVCRDTIELFGKEFGKSVWITRRWCIKHYPMFSWDCAARHLLSTQSRDEYQKVRTQAWDEFQKVRAQAFSDVYLGDA